MTTDIRCEGLHQAILDDFARHWAIGGVLVYASGIGGNPDVIRADLLADAGIAATAYDKLPDVVSHDPLKNRLFLVESVTSHGPVDGKRHAELARLFAGATAGLVYVTAFPNRSVMLNLPVSLHYFVTSSLDAWWELNGGGETAACMPKKQGALSRRHGFPEQVGKPAFCSAVPSATP